MTKRRRPAKRSAELEELRARLAEAQETLDAIRHGEVDALVVQDERGERIYSLTGAELPYRMLIEQMQEGAVTVDADGQILYANARFATLSGLALERVIGRPIGQLVAESDAPALLAMIATGAGRQEMEIIGATGTATSTLVSATRLDIGGVPCVGFIVTDLTPQKHHEERLALLAREREARADAEAASRAKDEFLAILSHELRTPLNAIFGWARMLRSQEPASEMAARAIAVIERNAMAQVRMIEDLLDISRVITGKMRLDVRPLDLAPVVAAAVESMTPAAQAKGITLEVVVAPGVGPVLADPQRMQQVVWNLVSNAIKFTAAGGRVSVELTGSAGGVECTVSDTGEGIDEALLPYVFDRFRQGDSTSTRAHGGLGIGLALVRHLTELHGGSVQAESVGKGGGARFTVRLPAVPEAGVALAPTAPGSGGGSSILRGLRVVAVDDDRDSLDLVETLLRDRGVEVRTYTSASEAIEAVASWNAALVISDIRMPQMDGYMLMTHLRTRLARDRALRAIALTAGRGPEDVRLALEAGYDVHIGKPFEPQELLLAVEKLVTS